MVLSYLDCDSDRNSSSLAFCTFSVLTRGLPALVVCLAGAVEAGRSPSGKEGRRGLPRANVMVVPPWLSPGIAPEGVSDINLTPSSFSGVAGLVFPFLEACSAFSLAVRARSASFGPVSPLASAQPCVFACTTYFRFGIGSELPIGSFCRAK
jgi:hypothetical protein